MFAALIQPETWKAIGEYSGRVWTAVSPVVYIFIGGWLGRAWDRQKWKLENRKEECRELLASITHARIVILDIGDVHAGSEAYEALTESLKTFDAQIFIAEDIEKAKLFDTWQTAVHEFVTKKINKQTFSDRVDDIRKTIIGLRGKVAVTAAVFDLMLTTLPLVGRVDFAHCFASAFHRCGDRSLTSTPY